MTSNTLQQQAESQASESTINLMIALQMAMAKIQQMEEQMGQLQEEQGRLQARQEGSRGTQFLRVAKPEPFKGERKKLRAFVTQMDLYLGANPTQFEKEEDKVLMAAGFMQDTAFDWVERFVHAYHHEDVEDWNSDITKAFRSYKDFVKMLETAFGEVDKEMEAERIMRNLKQKGSVSEYAAKFLQQTARMNFEDNAYIPWFYDGLKDRVKDEIARVGRPRKMAALVDLSTKIDNRQWEREMEKKRQGPGVWGQRKEPKGAKKNNYDDPYGLQPMDIDSRQTTDDPRKAKKKTGKCYYCEKPGHFARECRKKQADKKNGKLVEQARATKETKIPDEQVRVTHMEKVTHELRQTGMITKNAKEFEQNAEQLEQGWKNPCTRRDEDKCNDWHCRNHFSTRNPARNAAFAQEDSGGQPPVRECDEHDVRHPKHDSMHWTACYEDGCTVHEYGKQGGYFPQAPTHYRRLKGRYERIWRQERKETTEIEDFEVVEAQALVTRTVSQLSTIIDEEEPEQPQQRRLKINPEDLKTPSEGFGTKPRSPTLTIKDPKQEVETPIEAPWWAKSRKNVRRPETPVPKEIKEAIETDTSTDTEVSTDKDDTWWETVVAPRLGNACIWNHWLLCDNDVCEEHLAEKQQEEHFPRDPCAYDKEIDDDVMSREPIRWHKTCNIKEFRQADESYRGHSNMTWKECTNDECSYHYTYKKNNKWFPQEIGDTIDEGRYHWHIDMQDTTKPRICYKTRCAQARVGRIGATSYQQMVKAVRKGFNDDARGFRVYKAFMQEGMMGALMELQKQAKN